MRDLWDSVSNENVEPLVQTAGSAVWFSFHSVSAFHGAFHLLLNGVLLWAPGDSRGVGRPSQGPPLWHVCGPPAARLPVPQWLD